MKIIFLILRSQHAYGVLSASKTVPVLDSTEPDKDFFPYLITDILNHLEEEFQQQFFVTRLILKTDTSAYALIEPSEHHVAGLRFEMVSARNRPDNIPPNHWDFIVNNLQQEEVSPLRPYWENLGWHRIALAESRNSFARSGKDVTMMRQEKGAWSRSMILKVISEGETYYFKSEYQQNPKEYEVIQLLEDNAQVSVPKIYTIVPQYNSCIYHDFGNVPLKESMIQAVDLTVSSFARLQIEFTNRIKELEGINSRNRTFDKLSGMIMDTIETGTCTSAQKNLLKELLEEAEPIMHKISEYKIPSSIHHEDFRFGNIALFNGRPLIYDWGGTAIAHPFFSIHYFICGYRRPRDIARKVFNHRITQENRRSALQAYLSEWRTFEPMERLYELYEYIGRLSYVYEVARCLEEYRHLEPDSIWAKDTWSHAVDESFLSTCIHHLRDA